MMFPFESELEKALSKRKDAHSLRELVNRHHLVDFSSNDYLGLSRNPELQERVKTACESLGQKNLLGSTGSRLISGNSELVDELELYLAKVHQGESALVFNSGYVACLGVLSTLPQKGDTILYDELSHVCLKEGARLSIANHFSFRHNDLEDLERRLKKAEGTVFVVVESIYSMDGDCAPLAELVTLSNKYGALLVVDEAHSTGVYGKSGAGLCVELGIEKEIFVRIHTFGKAIGAHGSCVVGSSVVKQYLINFCRSFIYTTALSPHSLVAIQEAYRYLEENPQLSEVLLERIRLFDLSIGSALFESPIRPVLVPGNEACRKTSIMLQEKGFDVRAILSPTVPAGKERLRISLHAHNTTEEILEMTQILKSKA